MSVEPIAGLRAFQNPNVAADSLELPPGFSREGFDAAWSEISRWPGYEPSPLISLKGLAKEFSVGEVLYKDESKRFGLGSFKALGGAYAVFRILQEHVTKCLGREVTSKELSGGIHREITRQVTAATATAGNHGRAVAWGAARFKCDCVVYVPRTCSVPREAAIRSLGARTVRTDLGYDETVLKCTEDAADSGWLVVSDTSWEGYERIPTLVMQGYTVMTHELMDQMGSHTRPTHVFIQAGVGGLAGAVVSEMILRWGKQVPWFVIVEPHTAAGLYESAVAGRRVRVTGATHSLMKGLDCAEVSPLAWRVLAPSAHFFVTIPETETADTMRLLLSSRNGDPSIVAGESAVAGLVALRLATRDRRVREALRLDSDSVILLFGTEGATDAELYRKIIALNARRHVTP
jgi:diaminopropionate ammonia-lyase